MMQITVNQIHTVHDQVSDFLRHDYFDVRLEIADHLLAHIEELTTQNPEMPFYTALNEAFATIGGPKGIRKIERSKIYETWKAFVSHHLKTMLKTFRPPQVFLSILLLLMIYQIVLITKVFALWLFILGCVLTGVAETIVSYDIRRKYGHFGISSARVFIKSAWVTNTPLLSIYLIYRFDLGWWSDPIVAIAVFTYLLFFMFKFHYLQNGIKQDLARYSELHHDLITKAL